MIGEPRIDRVLALESLALARRHDLRLLVEQGGQLRAEIPVLVIVGTRHHPCLGLVAGVHGDEYDGILTLQDLARELAPAYLEGTCIVIPVANPFAFTAATRVTPEDGLDLNRVFPGRPDGSLTECLAHSLCDRVLGAADLVFSLHGARSTGSLQPWLEFLDVPGEVGGRSYSAALASGFPNLIALPQLPGVLMAALAAKGIPLIEGEIGGRGEAVAANVKCYRARVERVARHIGVLSGGPDPLTESEPRVWHLDEVRAETRGIFFRGADLGTAVRAGEVMGRIVDATGEVVSWIRAPRDATVGAVRLHAGVAPGDGLFSLWIPAGVSATSCDTPSGAAYHEGGQS